MKGWRGAMASKISPKLLRRLVSPILPATFRPAHPRRVDEIRAGNLSAVRGALGSAQVAFHEETHGDQTRVNVPRGTEPSRLRGILEAAGLSILEPPKGAPASEALRATSLSTGNIHIDRSLAVSLALGADATKLALPDLLEPSLDIDLVYTWVDGTDPEWQRQRRSAAGAESRPLLQTSNDSGRFIPHDELKYSLRSVDYFAPWVRNIYLVTSGQIPPWLDQTSSRIRVVRHEEIFEDPSCLPTFNSHAIESQLHRIPGLSEHFIYMNDDVFLGQAVSPGDFFTPDGRSRFFLSDQVIRRTGDGALPVDIAATNNRTVIEARFGRTVTRKFKHAPHPQLRSTLQRIAEENSEAVAATAASRFRSSTDLSIPSALAHYYGLGLGVAVPSEIGYSYTDISKRDAQARLLRLLRRGVPATFCLNEVEAGTPRGFSGDTATMLADFLPRVFPIPSTHEARHHPTPTAQNPSPRIEGPRQ